MTRSLQSPENALCTNSPASSSGRSRGPSYFPSMDMCAQPPATIRHRRHIPLLHPFFLPSAAGSSRLKYVTEEKVLKTVMGLAFPGTLITPVTFRTELDIRPTPAVLVTENGLPAIVAGKRWGLLLEITSRTTAQILLKSGTHLYHRLPTCLIITSFIYKHIIHLEPCFNMFERRIFRIKPVRSPGAWTCARQSLKERVIWRHSSIFLKGKAGTIIDVPFRVVFHGRKITRGFLRTRPGRPTAFFFSTWL